MKKFVYLLLGCFLLLGCNETDDSPINNLKTCSANQACTEIFVSLTFTPRGLNGQTISLDSFYTQNLDNGNTYSIQNSLLDQEDTYTVVTDNELTEINMNGTNLRFFGLIGNQIVVQQDFVVGHDCCHVTSISGPFNE
ncbi:hypothetical protein [Roseivirga misakiensis]|uniref:Lipoprotein n=1 Tax=Roseivirga misakiensis TaxID=1563681 RepID=A0A1E5T194_9BACT|nr:hypothetical protein [Roseivirga misakiensis]OEK05131.1 hypothetical protein BFP71_17090 [Roseivirga misakiensis]